MQRSPYDALDLLDNENPINVGDAIGTYDYQYDSNGNRTMLDGFTETYVCTPASNRMSSYVRSEDGGITVEKDVAGNITRLLSSYFIDDFPPIDRRLAYNESGRLEQYEYYYLEALRTTTNYRYNDRHQCTEKVVNEPGVG